MFSATAGGTMRADVQIDKRAHRWGLDSDGTSRMTRYKSNSILKRMGMSHSEKDGDVTF